MGNSYTDLQVWQVAVQLVIDIYVATRKFPREEMYALTSQLRKAAVSVPSNIAEGQGRVSRKEFHQFLGQARGSLMEAETQLVIAHKLGYIGPDELAGLLRDSARVKQMLYRLMESLSSEAEKTHVQKPSANKLLGERGTGNGERR